MSNYFILKNKIVGGAVAQYFDESIRQYVESNYPTGQAQPPSVSSLVPITGLELAQLVNKYYALKSEELARKAHGSSDFLPFAFLSRGLRCGSPVCLLLRQYTESSIQEIFEAINSNNYSTRELSNLLKIDNYQEFWEGHETVLEALEKVDNMRTRLSDYIKSKPLAVGTGFLVGRDYMMTNHHVLPDSSIASDFIARFKYEIDSQGDELDAIDYKLEPSFFITSNGELDYTIIKILPLEEEDRKQKGLAFREAGNNFGWLHMPKEENEAVAIPPIPCLKRTNFLPLALKQVKKLSQMSRSKIASSFALSPIIGENAWARSLRKDIAFQQSLQPEISDKLQIQGLMGQAISIIQHPKGNRKEIVVDNNRVQAIYQNWIQYETDAEPGSSGSPLFNSQWQLIGLHHSAFIDTENGEIIGYLGTRVCRIVQDLRRQLQDSKNAELEKFLIQYVDNPKRGKIFISAGRKRELQGLEDKAQFEADVLFKLGSKVVEHIQLKSEKYSYGLEAIHIQQQAPETLNSAQAVISWLQKDKKQYQPGDVALEILLDAVSQPAAPLDHEQSTHSLNGDTRGAKVYYFRNRAERNLNAESLLKGFLRTARLVDKKVNGEQSNFPSQGAQPDTAVGRVSFCADVSIPSLVLYAGYLTNQQDCKLFDEAYLDQLAIGIANGLIDWANSLSPTII
ncbi:trypsin-like peptidase domain-containing protein [Leptolyngbya boryana CZ1]|uniref:Trypsin-like peptidase domain-containing protein n=1 Tax=Leptolyngbya boryana CZ1 TaxID=3060204 RepID=A0AA97AMA8_LEPBY|nr:trypsin-like peptidase domain-containing protein [Leptolyngbya boryana]WNZ44047.1 trypsin-like peptidase domain-containing protein [Leptolyngbya boryana CZ1]